MIAQMCNGIRQQNILLLNIGIKNSASKLAILMLSTRHYKAYLFLEFYLRFRTGGTTTRPECVFTKKGAPRDELSTPSDCLLRMKIAPRMIDIDVSVLTNCFHQSSLPG